jgi:hypothetical protein
MAAWSSLLVNDDDRALGLVDDNIRERQSSSATAGNDVVRFESSRRHASRVLQRLSTLLVLRTRAALEQQSNLPVLSR